MQCTIDEIGGFKSSLSRILHGLVIIDTNFIVQPLQVLINNLRKSPHIVVKEHHSSLVILRTGRTRLKFMFKTKMFKKKKTKPPYLYKLLQRSKRESKLQTLIKINE